MTENYSFYFFNNLHIRNINAALSNRTLVSKSLLVTTRCQVLAIDNKGTGKLTDHQQVETGSVALTTHLHYVGPVFSGQQQG